MLKRVVLLALLMIVPAVNAESPTTLVGSIDCALDARPGIPSTTDCTLRPLAQRCLTSTTYRERMDAEDVLEYGATSESCDDYVGGPEVCDGVNCGVFCDDYNTCIGTFYHRDDGQRYTGVVALNTAVVVEAGPDGVIVHYGSGLTHCQTGLDGHTLLVHECVV